jgi:hypothetical protein
MDREVDYNCAEQDDDLWLETVGEKLWIHARSSHRQHRRMSVKAADHLPIHKD